MDRQKLINYKTSGTTAPLPANIEYGEIAVQYNPNDTCLYIKDTAGTIRKFIDEQAVDKMIIDYLKEYGVIQQPSTVDMGLPSGTLWCECNIGAETPYEPGLYFAWGETEGYTSAQVGVDKYFYLNFSDYKFGNPPTKYNSSDGKTTLETTDDAGMEYFGNPFIMPTEAQFQELINGTTRTWDSTNNCMEFTSTANGNKLFFPAAGYCREGRVDGFGSFGGYWSSSLNAGSVLSGRSLDFYSSGSYGIYNSSRYYGFSVRPVKNTN